MSTSSVADYTPRILNRCGAPVTGSSALRYSRDGKCHRPVKVPGTHCYNHRRADG